MNSVPTMPAPAVASNPATPHSYYVPPVAIGGSPWAFGFLGGRWVRLVADPTMRSDEGPRPADPSWAPFALVLPAPPETLCCAA